MTTQQMTVLEMVLDQAKRDLDYTSKDLRAHADRLRTRMDRLMSDLDADYNVNSLGEVQQLGHDVDRLCALRQERAENVRRIEWAIRQDAARAQAATDPEGRNVEWWVEFLANHEDPDSVAMCEMCGTRPVAPGDDLCERCGA